MFFFLSKFLDIFFSPYTWALILLVAAVPWRSQTAHRWRWRRASGGAALLILVVGGSQPFANALTWNLEHASTSTYREDKTYDAAILLGGLVDEDVTAATGLPTFNENVERMIATFHLLHTGKARVAIVSSGTVNPKLAAYSETAVISRQLEEWGIAKDRILLEDRALNTHDNAVYSQQIAQQRGLTSVVIVTSAFHMPRAAECFAAVGMKVDTLAVDYRARAYASRKPADWLPRASEMSHTTMVLRERFGHLVYRARGYGKPVP